MNDTTSRRRRLRFSLRTILLLVVIIALGVAQFVAMRRVREVTAVNRRLAQENEKLRGEVGYLEADDRTKVQVVRIPTLDEFTWRWKVYLPPGKWTTTYMVRGIPRKGFPDAASFGPVDGGREVLVAATVRKGADGKWNFRVNVGGESSSLAKGVSGGYFSSGGGHDLDDSHRLIDATAPMHGSSDEIAGDRRQESLDPDNPVVLLRLRVHEPVAMPGGGWKTKEDPESSDGVFVWLFRAK